MLNGFWVLGDARFANEGHREALRMLNVVKAKSSLHAQAIVIGWTIAPFHAHNAVVFDVVGEQASHATEGTH